MKKRLCLMFALMIVLSAVSGCGNPPAETTGPDPAGTSAPTEETASPAETTIPPETESPLLEELRNNLPRMDGSTSMIPLEAGIRAAIFGKSIEEATKDVSHSTTWDSFYNLIWDRTDLIFSVPLSAQQEEQAIEQNVVLEAVPIAMEGFVFVVNADNPVNSLTQQQIKDIYSGKITNWSQVGGLDEEIIPYQRNWDSGSQNYMVAFMGSTPLLNAPMELRPASMSGLMDVIAVNDHSRAAIGYSVYAYAADMYGNGNEIKFLKIDGIAPNKQAFSDRSYPLMGYNYAVFKAEEPEGSPVRNLVEWMLTREGQLAIARAGYVTITDVGYDYEEQTVTRYSGFGSGEPAGKVPDDEYLLSEKVVEVYDNGYTTWENEIIYPMLVPQIVTRSDGTQIYQIHQLTDSKLEAEVNAWLADQMDWVADCEDEVEALVTRLNQAYEYDPFTFDGYNGVVPESARIGRSQCIVSAKNGILSAVVTLRYFETKMEAFPRYYRTETASWDLITGKRLSVEDLFCRGVDIDETLNTYLRKRSQQASDYYADVPEMKADFATLPLEGWHITHDTIYFDYDNPYFVHGEAFSLEHLPDGTLSAEQPRDFRSAITSDAAFVRRQYRVSDRDLYYAYNSDGLLSCGFLKEDAHPNAAAINAEVMDYLNTYYTEKAIRSYFEDNGYNSDNLELYMLDWYTEKLGNRFIFFTGYTISLYMESDNSFIPYPRECALLYNLQTGEQIHWRDVLRPGWEDAVIWEEGRIPPDGMNAQEDWFRLYNGEHLSICYRDGNEYYYAQIPSDYFLY